MHSDTGITEAHERSARRPPCRSIGLQQRLVYCCGFSDEIFASAAGAVHPVHCLTRRDAALYKGERRLTSLRWHQATSIKVRFCGHMGDQAQQGSVIVFTRDDASGTRSG